MIIRNCQRVRFRKEVRCLLISYVIDTETFFRSNEKGVAYRTYICYSSIYNTICLIILLEAIAVIRVQSSSCSKPHHAVFILIYSRNDISAKITL